MKKAALWPRFGLGWVRRVRRTDKILVLCVAFLVGLVVARWHLTVPGWFVVAVGLLLVTGVKRPVFQVILLVVFGLSLGVWREAGYLQTLQPYHDFAQQQVTLQGKVSLDAVYGKNGQLAFEVKKVQFMSPRSVSAPGTIKVSGYGEFAVYRGDVVTVTGKLYPTRGGKQATIGYAQIKRVDNQQTAIDSFRRSFTAGMQSALPEPAASFALGLLVGQRNTLPYDVSQAFLMVGLTHIIAVSGYNLTILLNGARKLTGERSKLFTTGLGVGLMLSFLALTGAAPSIVRASVVSGLALAAWYYGRPLRPMVLILMAAALTSYATPVYFWSDIGWWLSMLAFFGIVVIAPKLTAWLFPHRAAPMLPQIAIETLAAEIMTIPLVMWVFGQVSLIGLLANVLVAFFIPFAMLLSLVAGLAGMLVPLVAGWFAWPAQLLLTYMLDVTMLLSRVPHVFQTNTYLSVFDMSLCYLLVLGLVVLLYRRRKPWFIR